MKLSKKFCALALAMTLAAGVIPLAAFAQAAPAEDETASNVTASEEPSGPLTPDGNLTLVDDVGSRTGAGKQFVTFVTKNGNYFYLVIDRDDKGTETVHFLNLVDESDLLALMEDEDAAAYRETHTPIEREPEPSASPTPEPASVAEPEPEPKSSGVSPALLLIPLALAGGGAACYLLMQKKKKQAAKEKPDPDADYSDEEDGYGYAGEEDEAAESDGLGSYGGGSEDEYGDGDEYGDSDEDTDVEPV